MASRVFVHIGLPKTATTYLQRVLWENEPAIRAQGVLLPGEKRRDHLWVTRLVREELLEEGMTPWQAATWDRLRPEIAAWPGTALLSHEFFAAASAEQVARFLADLAPAEVHVVVTAREPVGLFAASWQESLKNRETEPMATYAAEVSDDPTDIWNWRTLDLGLVLERWAPPGGAVAPEHVHVLPLPGTDQPRDTIWRRFAEVVGIDGSTFDLSATFPNESMGVAEAETLRRVNRHLDGFFKAIDKGTFIRTYLADQRLVPRGGERFWPTPAQVEDCRARGERAVALIAERGFDLVGDPADLLVPAELAPRRTPDSVSEAEVASVATELVARMLDDYRRSRHVRRRLERRIEDLEEQLEEVAERAAAPVWRIAGSRAKRALGRRREPVREREESHPPDGTEGG